MNPESNEGTNIPLGLLVPYSLKPEYRRVALKRIQGGGGSTRQSKQLNADETRLIQEIHQGLSKMDGRIEALEILLLDREEKHAKKGDDK